jgi:hypothetical protein
MSKDQNNAQIIATCNQRLTALKKHVTSQKATVPINGQPMKLTDLVTVYQDAVDTRSVLVEQRAAYHAALTGRDSADTTRQAVDAGLRAWVTTQYGLSSPEAAEFGFQPRKVTARSAGTVALAVEKSAATRLARGTGGKRQKAKIKGTVVAPTAPADPAVPSPATPSVAVPAAAAVAAVANGGQNGVSH